MMKDVRVMTGFLRRIDEERWEAVYEADGTLYMSETFASRELAERHLAKHRDLLEAAGYLKRGDEAEPTIDSFTRDEVAHLVDVARLHFSDLASVCALRASDGRAPRGAPGAPMGRHRLEGSLHPPAAEHRR